MKGHGDSCAPYDATVLSTASTVFPPNARPPIAPAIIPRALAVPTIYADSPYLSRHRSETLSIGDISLLHFAWTDLTPSLDYQDTILVVNRLFGNSLAPLPSADDGALLARRAQANEVSAAVAFETAQTLTSEVSSAPQRGRM